MRSKRFSTTLKRTCPWTAGFFDFSLEDRLSYGAPYHRHIDRSLIPGNTAHSRALSFLLSFSNGSEPLIGVRQYDIRDTVHLDIAAYAEAEEKRTADLAAYAAYRRAWAFWMTLFVLTLGVYGILFCRPFFDPLVAKRLGRWGHQRPVDPRRFGQTEEQLGTELISSLDQLSLTRPEWVSRIVYPMHGPVYTPTRELIAYLREHHA